MLTSKWSIDVDFEDMQSKHEQYIANLPEHIPSVEWVWQEMDRVWDSCGLNNRVNLSLQNIGDFYGHPVWIMNGLFTEVDPESKSHRMAISLYLREKCLFNVADYGGGSGVLAQVLANLDPNFRIDIIEPYAFEFFKKKLSRHSSVKYKQDFQKQYDCVVAQDVLEHVDDPIKTAFTIASQVREGGLVIFANCFYPFIKCHLPATFYLRHTFKTVMTSMGLRYIGYVPGAEHALVFEKRSELNFNKAKAKAKVIKPFGALLNFIAPALSKVKRFFMRKVNRFVK